MDGLSHSDISMETLQTSIVNAIKAIRSSKKRADELTIYKFVKRELHLITNTDVNNTLKILIEMGRIENKPSKDKSSYFLSDNNITDSEPHIPTIAATPLVETSSFTDILSPSVEEQINSFVSSDTEHDNNNSVLTDLSKAFDCIDHNLLIAKLNAYGFEKRSLEFIHSYLTKRKQRTKVDSAFSSWEMILSGVPQGSILGPLLFNIYICDMFFETPENIDFAGYADDNTPYTYSSKIEHVLTNLQSASEKLFSWFSANHLVANAGKCHLLTSSNLPVDIRITNTKISNVERVKLLGVNFEGRLNFDYHVNTLLKKANKKYHALARVCNYMDAKKRRVLMNAFITSQFSYCPLVWMFHSRTLNNQINKIHEKALRLVFKNETFSSFDDLLKRDKSVSIHQKNLQILATEIYKTKNDLGPKIMKDTFHFIQKPYNLRNDPELQRRRNRTVYFGTESISSLAPKIWELVPSNIRSANSLEIFKEKIKSWTTDKCPCRLCKTYIGNVGFI